MTTTTTGTAPTTTAPTTGAPVTTAATTGAGTAAPTAATGAQGAAQNAPHGALAPEHPPRLAFAELHPEFYKAMTRLEIAAAKHVDPTLYELVKIRASQINNCAFCLDMHTKDALAAGESVQRIVQLAAWRESRHFYTERELAALALTEAVTVLTDGFVPDEVYAEAARHFDETSLAHVIGAIIAINSWNRIAVTCRFTPGHYTPGGSRR
ncbi:carboxymuconolactone decarboxylase family protein [Streptomyces roseicoloratus]|uniref:Carboxymuconolactone decarboxylase family protein n=1 Tax=Streptomyces roseicoloratus TaxID=2508722 RepID=A0ABY9RTD0_9ACTN|nr:carboxymuconolactone decarboxylase family protein [Streptomyces roseicoloratus]WMX45431.1 carboxymuconolactone decarboxylase family protein [Streptomyces roseicoloratus]